MSSTSLQGLNWRKATPSIGNGECVEACNRDGAVNVRDTADHAGTVLAWSPAAWRAFTSGVKAGAA